MDQLKSLLLVVWLAVGWHPAAEAIVASDGIVYGIGPKSPGYYGFYRYTPESGTEFLYASSALAAAAGDIIEGTDGAFYGMTRAEVLNDDIGHGTPLTIRRGTAFRITKGGSFKTLAIFDTDSFPADALVQAYDGNFYGVANALEALGQDKVFRMSSSGKVEPLAYISERPVPVPGLLPYVQLDGNLIVGPGGDLFGTSHFIDDETLCSVFKVSLKGVVTIIKRFKQGTVHGNSRLSVGDNGNLYLQTNDVIYEIVTSNLPPVAKADSFSLPVVQAKVLANDSDPNGDPVQVIGVTNGSHGTVTFTPDGRVTYSPGPDFDAGGIQNDTFTYTIRDPLGGMSTATVTVTIPEDIFSAGAGSYTGFLTAGGLAKGLCNLSLTKSGAFTGALVVDGVRTALSGTFGEDGTYSATITRGASDPALAVTLQLEVISNAITGTLSDGTNSHTVNLSRNRNVYSLERPTWHRGKYTALITNNEAGPSVPGGTGFARMSVAANGAVVLTGNFGDGAPFSAGASLNTDNIVPLFVRAYSRKAGYLAGEFAFRLTDTSDAAGSLTWHKPPQANDTRYPAGFTTTGTFQASRYLKIGNIADPIFGFEYLGLCDNAVLTLTENPSKQLRWNRYSYAMLGHSGDKTNVTFDPLTGLFRGAYFDAGIRHAVKGAIYQSTTPSYAAGLGFDQNGTLNVSIVAQ